MKLRILSSFLFACIVSSAQNFIWTQEASYSEGTGGSRIRTDAQGNVFVSGSYGEVYSNNPPTAPSGVFLNKYSPDGVLQWSKLDNKEWSWLIGMDNLGQPVLQGYDTLGFFFARISGGGSFSPKQYPLSGSSKTCRPSPIVFDSSGNYYVSGTFIDTLIIGSGTFTVENNATKVFFAKFDVINNSVWGKVSDAGDPSDAALQASPDGGLLIFGSFYSSMQLGSKTLTTSFNLGTGFLARYDSDGNCEWFKKTNNKYQQFFNSLTFDRDGNMYATGIYTSPLGAAGATFYPPPYDYDIFLTKLDSAGNAVWLKSVGGEHHEVCGELSVNPEGDIYLAGIFSYSITFDNTHTLISNIDPDSNSYTSPYESFVAKFTNSGQVKWVQKIGCTSAGRGFGYSVISGNGCAYITGEFQGPVYFGQTKPLTGTGIFSAYVSRIQDFDYVGIKENNTKTSISVYPSPANKTIFVSHGEDITNGEIILINGNGIIVKKYLSLSENSSFSVDIADLPAGIYFLQLKTGNDLKCASFIKE